MKKIILTGFAFACLVTGAFAQKLDEAKNLVILQNYKKAKEALDKSWAHAKFKVSPEAYLLKATIAAYTMGDSANAGNADALRGEAIEAFEKYKEMEPTATLLSESGSIYSNTPILLYSHFFNSGIAAYNGKKWPEAFEQFKRAVDYSEYLAKYKLANIVLDTNAILLAGASAQAANKMDDASGYFMRLADAKVGGKDNEFLYQFLTQHFLGKGEMDQFNKYKGLGKELYPNSEYFTYEDIDFILNLEEGPAKAALIEKKLAADPNNYKVQAVVGEMYFEQLNPKDPEKTPLPANFDEIEAKMETAFNKATELKPDGGLPMSNLANHFMNKSIRINKELDSMISLIRTKNQAAMAKAPKPKPGAKPIVYTTPEDAAARDAIQLKYMNTIAKAGQYFEKATGIFSKLSAPTMVEKQQYRNSVSYLIDINKELKNFNKAKPAEFAKFDKEEKKWTALYSTL